MAAERTPGEECLFEVTAFLVTSAKRCLGPDAGYGPGRLVQAMNLLSHLPEEVPGLVGNPLLDAAREYVEGDPHWWFAERLGPFIDRMSEELLQAMKARMAGG